MRALLCICPVVMLPPLMIVLSWFQVLKSENVTTPDRLICALVISVPPAVSLMVLLVPLVLAVSLISPTVCLISVLVSLAVR